MHENCKVMLMRSIMLVCCMLFLIVIWANLAGSQDILHAESKPTWQEKPSGITTMTKRINQSAQELSGITTPRAAFFDIGFPANPQEFDALDGNAVILVTALSREKTELPLKRVYSKVDGNTIELKRITYILSKEAPNSPSTKTFGQYRMDSLYLCPVYLRTQPGELAIDFARNRDGFRLAKFDAAILPELAGVALIPPSGKGPSLGMLKRFIAREFPGFNLH